MTELRSRQASCISVQPCSRKASAAPVRRLEFLRPSSLSVSLFNLDTLSLRERVGRIENQLILGSEPRGDFNLGPIVVTHLYWHQLYAPVLHYANTEPFRTEEQNIGRQGHRRIRSWNGKMHEGILARQQLMVLIKNIHLHVQCPAGNIDCVRIADDGSDEFLIWSSIGRHHDMVAVVHSVGINLGYRNEEA